MHSGDAQPEGSLGKDRKRFVVFANCQVVKGSRRSLVVDLTRGKLFPIPNDLADILSAHNKKTVEEVKDYFKHDHDETIDEYFAFLAKHELVFFTENPERFPELDLSWKSPLIATNAVVDIGQNSQHDFNLIFSELDTLGVEALELRFFSSIMLADIAKILQYVDRKRVRSISLVVKYSPETSMEGLRSLWYVQPRIHNVTVYAAPMNYAQKDRFEAFSAVWTSMVINSATCCGMVSEDGMIAGLSFFSEAKNFNSCLNRKIAIDEEGNLKNCPALPASFGSHRIGNFRQVLDMAEFRKLWYVTKDQIEVCKDCEFRYSCKDCRAFSGGNFGKPTKCKYNPYTATWEK